MFFDDTDLNVEIIGVYKIKRPAVQNESFNNRHYFSLSFRTKGSATFKFDSETIKVNSEKVLFIPPNASYSQTTDGETVIAIHFMLYNYYSKSPETLRLTLSSDINEKFKTIYTEWSEKRVGYKNRCTSLLYDLFFSFNQEISNNQIDKKPSLGKIQEAVDYIHTNFKREQIQVSNLAQMSFLSETQFRKNFKAIFNISPNRYINNLRLETSIQLLESGLYSIKEVAIKSGFNDVKYFTRTFKEKYKFSPREYAKDYAKKMRENTDKIAHNITMFPK